MSTPSTFRLIVLRSHEQTTTDDASLSSDQPLSRSAALAARVSPQRRKLCGDWIFMSTFPLMSTSVFQENNHLFLRDKITLQSWGNMNDHEKTWFLTDRKPISRSGGLNFLLSLFKGGMWEGDWELGSPCTSVPSAAGSPFGTSFVNGCQIQSFKERDWLKILNFDSPNPLH